MKLLNRGSTWIFTGILLTGSICRLSAEAYIAVRTGYKCSQCHVNKTGGGKRTGFGSVYSQTRMPFCHLSTQSHSSFFNNMINNHVSLGGNFRVSNNTVVGTDSTRLPTESRFDNSIVVPEASFYAEINLAPNYLKLYIDEIFSPSGASSREAFAIVEGFPLNAYFKFGRFMMPYGLRLLDDNSSIRQRTSFTYANQDFGYEIGLEPGPVSVSLALTNGTRTDADENVDKQISLVGSTVFRHFRVGGSFSRNEGVVEKQTIYGVFGGLSGGVFTLMAEGDIILTTPVLRSQGAETSDELIDYGDEFVFFASLNTRIMRGVNLKIGYDLDDPRTRVREDERDRYIMGLELFPIQFLQVSMFYEYRTAPRQFLRENEDRVRVETHVFF